MNSAAELIPWCFGSLYFDRLPSFDGGLGVCVSISAVFLDRDGVLNEYLPGAYVRFPEELRVIAGVSGAIRRLNDAGIPVVVVSNQQGVGKGLMTADDLNVVEQHLCQKLKDENGAWLDKCYYCTDLNDANSPRRKPAPGMLLEAADEFGIDLSQAVMVGDSATDIAAARAAGVGSALLVLTGSINVYTAGDMTPEPDVVFIDLNSAVDWILEG
jgi:histidinol-phosphate phosphatase family protein